MEEHGIPWKDVEKGSSLSDIDGNKTLQKKSFRQGFCCFYIIIRW